eukprot:scaffold26659_cov35-Tisochrysis_lutea.AAC.2
MQSSSHPPFVRRARLPPGNAEGNRRVAPPLLCRTVSPPPDLIKQRTPDGLASTLQLLPRSSGTSTIHSAAVRAPSRPTCRLLPKPPRPVERTSLLDDGSHSMSFSFATTSVEGPATQPKVPTRTPLGGQLARVGGEGGAARLLTLEHLGPPPALLLLPRIAPLQRLATARHVRSLGGGRRGEASRE